MLTWSGGCGPWRAAKSRGASDAVAGCRGVALMVHVLVLVAPVEVKSYGMAVVVFMKWRGVEELWVSRGDTGPWLSVAAVVWRRWAFL